MPSIIVNQICVTTPVTVRYTVSGILPSACPGGAEIVVSDDQGEALRRDIPDGKGVVGPWVETSGPRNLPVGRTQVQITIAEVVLEALNPLDLTVSVDPPIGRPTITPCATGTEEPANFLPFINFANRDFNRLEFSAKVLFEIGTDIQKAERTCRAVMQAGDLIEVHPIDSRAGSGVIVVRSGEWMTVFTYGTTTASQLINQGNQMLLGPTWPLLGGVQTSKFWWDGADLVESFMNRMDRAGVRNYNLIGHSMGGAISCVLWSRLVQNENVTAYLVTFGSPKPGNNGMEFRMKLFPDRHINIENRGDMVPHLCPKSVDAFAISKIISRAIITVKFDGWKYPTSPWTLEEDGTITEGYRDEPGFSLLTEQVSRLIRQQPVFGTAAHGMAEYYRRVQLIPHN